MIGSLPRKWSMRKIELSGKTEWSTEFRSLADRRSRPNGFSTTTLASFAQPEDASASTTRPKSDGGIAR